MGEQSDVVGEDVVDDGAVDEAVVDDEIDSICNWTELDVASWNDGGG